jgi:hypothetical protein
MTLTILLLAFGPLAFASLEKVFEFLSCKYLFPYVFVSLIVLAIYTMAMRSTCFPSLKADTI